MKNLFLLSLIASCGLPPLAVSAVTVDDLCKYGGAAVEIYYGDNYQRGLIPYSFGNSHFEPVDGSADEVKLVDFFEGEIDLVFTLENDRLVMPDESYFESKKTNGYGIQINTTELVYGYHQNPAGNYGYGYFYNFANVPWEGSIVPTEVGGYKITFNPVNFTDNQKQFVDFSKIEVVIYPPNATITDTPSATGTQREYPAKVFVEGNTFQVLNFGNLGFSFRDYLDPSYDLKMVEGTIDKENGTVVISHQILNSSITSWVRSNSDISNWWTIGIQSGSPYFQITGTYSDKGVSHRGESRWHRNSGGSLETVENAVITLGEYTTARKQQDTPENGSVIKRSDGTITNTQIDMELDATLDVDLTVSSLAVAPDNSAIAVSGSVIVTDNAQYVDHYEIFIVPGEYGSINDEGFVSDTEKGHADAWAIVSDPADFTSSEDGGTLSFDKTVSAADITVPEDRKYTLFVKAHYTAESALAPTFHALRAVANVITGIDDAIDCGADVRVSDGRIIISGSDAMAEVFSVSGALAYRGFDREIDLLPGLYIVKVGGRAFKLAVD